MTPLDRLAAMVAEMTPGPWEYSCGTIGQDYEPWGDVVGIEDDGVSWTPTRSLVLKPEDAAGIVALRNAAEELIAVARAARDFYLNHEHLGWGGHEGMGKALDALEAKAIGWNFKKPRVGAPGAV